MKSPASCRREPSSGGWWCPRRTFGFRTCAQVQLGVSDLEHVVTAAHDHLLNVMQDFRSIVVLLPTGKDRACPLYGALRVRRSTLKSISRSTEPLSQVPTETARTWGRLKRPSSRCLSQAALHAVTDCFCFRFLAARFCCSAGPAYTSARF